MTPLAFTIIGLFAGLLLAFLAGSIGLMVYIFRQSKLESAANQARILRALNSSTIAIDRMRGEVALALSSMDANRLHEASLTIQHGVKQFQQAVGGLSKLVFAAGAAGDSMGLDQAYPDAVNDYPPDARQSAAAPDPFVKWRAEQEIKQQAAAGYATQLPVSKLSDIQQVNGSDLDDGEEDAYLDEYIQQHGRQLDDLPGVTDVGDGSPV